MQLWIGELVPSQSGLAIFLAYTSFALSGSCSLLGLIKVGSLTLSTVLYTTICII